MASVSAVVEDGKLIDSVNSSEKKTKESSSSLGKDDFLQLLVAQMKYQDPMEPASNTEYIQQYATYSELEQMMNMSETMDLQRASGFVGQMVCVQYTTEAGVDKTVEGIVDYVYYENGTPFVSIDGAMYKAEDVVSVYDATYVEATELSKAWLKSYDALPKLDDVTVSDYETVATLYSALQQFSDYTKGFISEDIQKDFQKYVDKVVELKKNENSENSENAETGNESIKGEDDTE